MSERQSNSVEIDEAKACFGELLERAAAGEEITITRHGIPLAGLVPEENKHAPAERRQAIERIKALSNGLRLGGLNPRDLIEEGRR